MRETLSHMKIVIPIKQVPQTSQVKMDPTTGVMVRQGVETVINPLDLYAIELGIELAANLGGKTTVISMGPAAAEAAIREAIAMGCDDGVLLSGREFAGSDTWATSYALAKAMARLSPYDLILCGERATDGDTGQVGPGIAAWLDLPVATYVSGIVECGRGSITVNRLVEDGCELLQVELPCVLTVVKEAASPRLPTLRGKLKAKSCPVPVWGPREIAADVARLGLAGSPTRVVKIESPALARHGRLCAPKDAVQLEQAVDGIVQYLQKLELL
jgi:electron transfer flavoprotein beta subunit